MNFKYLIIFLLVFSFLLSCKKKDSSTPEPVTNTTPQNAVYQGDFAAKLILTQNSNGFDTSFSFWGNYLKTIGTTETWTTFPSINFNGYLSNTGNNYNGNIISCPAYIKLSNNTTWNVTSSEFGNFQYNDTVPLPSIVTTSSTVPITFDAAVGIPLNITGIQNTEVITLDDKDDLYFNGYSIRNYQHPGLSIQDTIKLPELYNIPVNNTFVLTIVCGNIIYETFNNHNSHIRKYVTYNYNIKRIN